MGSLMRKGLISVVAAGLLSSAALAEGNGHFDSTISGLKTICDKETLKQNDTLHCTVTLLDANGKVDLAGPATLDTDKSKITVIATNGTKDPAAYNVQSSQSVYDFNVSDFTTTGAIQVQNVATLVDADGDAKYIYGEPLTINVTQADNVADYLKVESVTNSDGVSIAGTSDAIEAGKPFSLKIKAYDTDQQSTTYQNSDVTVKFIYTDNGQKKVGYETTAQMVNGVAVLNVPADTLTKDANYTIVVSTPTTLDKTGVESDGSLLPFAKDSARDAAVRFDHVADNYYDGGQVIWLDTKPLGIDKIEYSIRSQADNSVIVRAKAVDKYGNTAASTSISNAINLSCVTKFNGNSTESNTSMSIDHTNRDVNISLANIVDKNVINDGDFGSDGTITLELQCKDGDNAYPVFTQNVTGYKYKLQNTTDTNVSDADLVAGTYYFTDNGSQSALLEVGVMKYDDTQATDVNLSENNTTWASDFDLALVDANGNVKDEFSNIDTTATYVSDHNPSDLNATVPLYFTKAGEYSLRVTGVIKKTADNKEYKIAPHMVQSVNVNSGDYAKVEVKKYVKGDETANAKLEDVSEIAMKFTENPAKLRLLSYNNLKDNASTFIPDNNASKVDSNVTVSDYNQTGNTITKRLHYFGYYVVKFEDKFGNLIGANKSVYIDATDRSLIASITNTPKEFAKDDNRTELTYVATVAQGSTTLQLDPQTLGGEVINVDTSIKKVVDTLQAITVYAQTDTLLANSVVPITVTAQGDTIDQVSVFISDPTKVTLSDDYPNGNSINNGDALTGGTNSKVIYVQALASTGDVTLTFKNTSGSVSVSKTFHIRDTIPTNESAAVEGSVDIVAGKWNLITTPVPAPMPKSKLDTFTSKTVWAFDSGAYNYVAVSSEIEVGKGYWVKADKQGGTLTYSAVPTVADKAAQWTLIQNNLVAGKWNLIGTSFDTTKDEIKSALGVNSVWPYDPAAGQYSTAQSITAGHGMWVK